MCLQHVPHFLQLKLIRSILIKNLPHLRPGVIFLRLAIKVLPQQTRLMQLGNPGPQGRADQRMCLGQSCVLLLETISG